MDEECIVSNNNVGVDADDPIVPVEPALGRGFGEGGHGASLSFLDDCYVGGAFFVYFLFYRLISHLYGEVMVGKCVIEELEGRWSLLTGCVEIDHDVGRSEEVGVLESGSPTGFEIPNVLFRHVRGDISELEEVPGIRAPLGHGD